jgi:hypothetical protein
MSLSLLCEKCFAHYDLVWPFLKYMSCGLNFTFSGTRVLNGMFLPRNITDDMWENSQTCVFIFFYQVLDSSNFLDRFSAS